jgi:hypothetical protein
VSRQPKPAPPGRQLSRQVRLRLNKVYAGIADFTRNLGLLFIAAILVDMLVNPAHAVSPWRTAICIVIGLALFAVSLILAWIQKE